MAQHNVVYILWITIKKHDQHMIYTLYKPKTSGYALVYERRVDWRSHNNTASVGVFISTRTRRYVIHLDLVGFYLVGRGTATAAAAGLLHTPRPGVAALLNSLNGTPCVMSCRLLRNRFNRASMEVLCVSDTVPCGPLNLSQLLPRNPSSSIPRDPLQWTSGESNHQSWVSSFIHSHLICNTELIRLFE